MEADPHCRSRNAWPPAALAFVLALSSLAYVQLLPDGWTQATPLPWDQAGHYHQALRVANALRAGDVQTLEAAVREADLYPPGHSLALGAWFAAFGPGVAGWLAFGLGVFVATTALLYRAGPVAACAFLASPLLAGLAPSFLVEPLACLGLVLALSLFPRSRDGPVPIRRFVFFGLATAATLLTKYNVGLPLLPAAIVAAPFSRDRRVVVGIVVAVAFAAMCWAGFLFWQHDGWSSFLRFAENRSNSAGQSPFARLGWYVSTFANTLVGARALAGALGLLALAGGAWALQRRPRPVPDLRLLLGLGYVVVSLIALARHEYLLSRNLVGPAIALFFTAGLVSREMTTLRRRVATGLVVLLAVGTLATDSEPSRASLVERHYPARNRILRDLSEALVECVDRSGRTRVVGAFNEFSPGWIRVLEARHFPTAWVGVDAPYPLPGGRRARADTWSEVYAEIVAEWHRQGVDRILGIEVQDGGPFDSADYRTWNRWKQNLLRAADESTNYRLDASIELRGGITLEVYSAMPDSNDTKEELHVQGESVASQRSLAYSEPSANPAPSSLPYRAGRSSRPSLRPSPARASSTDSSPTSGGASPCSTCTWCVRSPRPSSWPTASPG